MTIQSSRKVTFVAFSFLFSGVQGMGDASNTISDVRESLSKMSETLDDAMDGFIEQSTLAGTITPLLNKLVLTSDQRRIIWDGITNVTSMLDVVLLLLVGFAVVPTVEVPYTRFVMNRSSKQTDRDFHSTTVYHVLASLAQIARLVFVVYAFDMVKIVLVGAGFEIPHQDRLTHAFAHALYTIWGATRLSKLKQYILEQVSAGDTRGRMQVVDRLGNFVLTVCALFMILNVLNVEIGLATRGAVAFGSVGTIIFSLAAKDTVANMLQGIILAASDRIYEGDSIRLHQSGFSGNVHRLGWLETVIRGSDNVMVTIPNADLLSQKVCNLSRINLSQVKQKLFSATRTWISCRSSYWISRAKSELAARLSLQMEVDRFDVSWSQLNLTGSRSMWMLTFGSNQWVIPFTKINNLCLTLFTGQ